MVFFPFSENQDKGHHFMFDLMPGQRLKKKKLLQNSEQKITSAVPRSQSQKKTWGLKTLRDLEKVLDEHCLDFMPEKWKESLLRPPHLGH